MKRGGFEKRTLRETSPAAQTAQIQPRNALTIPDFYFPPVKCLSGPHVRGGKRETRFSGCSADEGLVCAFRSVHEKEVVVCISGAGLVPVPNLGRLYLRGLPTWSASEGAAGLSEVAQEIEAPTVSGEKPKEKGTGALALIRK